MEEKVIRRRVPFQYIAFVLDTRPKKSEEFKEEEISLFCLTITFPLHNVLYMYPKEKFSPELQRIAAYFVGLKGMITEVTGDNVTQQLVK